MKKNEKKIVIIGLLLANARDRLKNAQSNIPRERDGIDWHIGGDLARALCSGWDCLPGNGRGGALACRAERSLSQFVSQVKRQASCLLPIAAAAPQLRVRLGSAWASTFRSFIYISKRSIQRATTTTATTTDRFTN